MTRRRDLLVGLLAAGALAASVLAPLRVLAQSQYPERPIRLVIPFPPGGVNDAVGRPWADKMKSLLGTVVVENQGGAGGSIGAAAVARAQPDGYTILLGGGGSHIINPIAANRPLYDPIKDFEPISILAVTTIGIAVHPSLPIHSLKELIDYAKASPGKLSYGSAGIGSFNNLTGELLKSLAGAADIVHVPYKGAGPALTDAVSGHIPVVLPNATGQVIALHRSGKLRIVAVTSPARLVALPDIPTAVEAGLPGMIAQNFTGLFAPAGTPPAIVGQISRATRAAMAEPDFRELLVKSGFEPQVDFDPAKTRAFVQEEIARWAPVIRAIGLKLD
jgi:tripartite-type tricarboxylate transporter receptor subunit TctC